MHWAIPFLVAFAVMGCAPSPLPDPNDPVEVPQMSGDVLAGNLSNAYNTLESRRLRGEITEGQLRTFLREHAARLVAKVNLSKVKPTSAYLYGDAYRTAEEWDKAKLAYEIAVRADKDVERQIIDGLRLAQCNAMLGDSSACIKLVKLHLDAKPEQCAPILPAVLLEIYPAAVGHGLDRELNSVLERAIDCHMRTVVDPNSAGGKAFLIARPHMVRDAWDTIIATDLRNGHKDAADSAIAKRDRMIDAFGSG